MLRLKTNWGWTLSFLGAKAKRGTPLTAYHGNSIGETPGVQGEGGPPVRGLAAPRGSERSLGRGT